MSCNGCRILRKGCSEDCMLRHCLQFIENPQAQANATVFVAKFFGRAGLMSFISSVPFNQRPSLFQSLLYEAVGRAVNPVSGAVGLLWTGNWHVCQTALSTVLRGGTIEPLQEFAESKKPTTLKRKRSDDGQLTNLYKRRAATPSSEESVSETTTSGSGSTTHCSLQRGETKLLRLFL